MAGKIHATLRNPDVPVDGKLSLDSGQRHCCHRLVTTTSCHAAEWQSLTRPLAPGNSGAYALRRMEGDTAHFLMVTFWDSEEAIRAFAGDDIRVAKYYDFDRDFLLELEPLPIVKMANRERTAA